MNTRMTSMAIANARRRMNNQKQEAPKAEPQKGLLLRKTNDTMSKNVEPEAIALLRRVRKTMQNA